MIELPILDGSEPGGDGAGPKLWRSLPQLNDDPAARQMVRDEFMPGADEAPSGANRRQFLQLVGASMAVAGLTACRRPEEPILPYTQAPEEVIPGIALYYATAMPFRGTVRGLLVETHEGRPTKVEGNPEHPVTRGRTSAFEQASVLNLYDPDRSTRVLRGGEPAAMNDFIAAVRQLVANGANSRVVLMAGETSSPTFRGMVEQLRQRFPLLRTVTYNAEGDSAAALGAQEAFGRPLRPFYQISKRSVIVSLDDDFLSPVDLNFVHNTLSFADSRDLQNPGDTMSRLYVVESGRTITGAKSDHRVRLRASEIPFFAAALAEQLGVATGGLGGQFADDPLVAAIAEDLRAAGAEAIVMAGETQPQWVHALAAAMNSALGSIGRGVLMLDPGEEPRASQTEEFRALAASMAAGQVDALVILGANPVYSAPGDINFAEAMQRVPLTIHHGLHIDETAQASGWHVPATHFMEQWGDGRAYDGTLSVIQPLIAPLYDDALSDIEVLNLLATGAPAAGYDLVRQAWEQSGFAGGDFEQGWNRAVHDGFVPNTQYPVVTAQATFAPPAQVPVASPDQMELVFRLDGTVLDGSFANNAWMQELPDQINKISWDNYAAVSASTAARLGLEVEYDAGKFYTDVVEITAEGRSVRLPVWIVPGHPDNTITATFGYGRNIRSLRPEETPWFFDSVERQSIYRRGALANEVGVNVYPLRPSTVNRVLVGVNVEKVDSGYMLATTQEHGSMEGRPIVRHASIEEFRADPAFAEEAVPPLPGGEPWDEYPELWHEDHPMGRPEFKENPYFQHQWGMSIDLNRCTGCSACMVACISENNIQMVGKEQIARGREMLWLRVDRYFIGGDEEGNQGTQGASLDNAEIAFQPMFCVHCENAPCEPVCPVYATSHSPDGISEMTYNRCIGTRYCSNNCPYKVRKFNYLNWSKNMPDTVAMQMNPNVTVRFRGVMEKCTYCVQRIREADRNRIVEQRPLRDGEVLTACQQVCPADAIVFGNINDPDSQVSREKQIVRNYEVLAELNVKPRTSYQSLVKNPNPRLVTA